MDFGPLDMLQLMHTVYAVPPPLAPEPVVPIPPVPFVPGDFNDMWCRNPQGDKVEWYIMYKAPAMTVSKGSQESISNGLSYGYIDSSTKLSQNVRLDLYDDISSTDKNSLYNTLDVLFKYPRTLLFDKNLTYLSYNDKPPAELSNSSTNGHAKGVLLMGQNSGSWVVHSMDHFGKFFEEKYNFPDEARREGQNILCMSIGVENWPKIISHLKRESPNIYDWNIPPYVFDANPGLKDLVGRSFNHEEPYAESNVLTGVNGTDFMALSKNAMHNFDIYETLVAPHLEANIFVRGSQQGDQKLDNFCNADFNVTEVDEGEIKLGVDTTFKKIRRSQDNSKWVVSERDYWVCIGSVERRKSHVPRGAEAFCFQNQPANILLANSIDSFTRCEKLPDDIAAKAAAVAAGTAVAVAGADGAASTYVRPVYIRPSFGVPRIYYGGLPSLGFGFPFTKILKNPLVVGAAVAGVMHYRHKQQIKKLTAMNAYGGRGGYPSYPSYPPQSAASKYSLGGLFGSKNKNVPNYAPPMGGGYPTQSGYPSYGGHPSYPNPGYPTHSNPGYPSHSNPGYPTHGNPGYPNAGHPSPGYPSAPHGSYPSPPHGSYPSAPHGAYPSSPHSAYPSSPHGSYPSAPGSYPSAPTNANPGFKQQPAYNPGYNPPSAGAPSAPTAQNVPRQQSSQSTSGSRPPTNTNVNRGGSARRNPVTVEKTVTRTVTSYVPSRTASRGSTSTSGRGSSSGGGSRRGGGRRGSKG